MPRAKKIDRPQHVSIRLPTSIVAKMEIELFSDLIGAVPHGAKSELVEGLVRRWLVERGVSC
jgi:hypothetical protein